MRARQLISLALLAAYLPACTSYELATKPVPELLAPPKPAKELKVWMGDGQHFVIKSPSIRNDSLFGTEGGGTTDARAVAVPIDSIRAVETPSGSGEAVLILGIVGVGLLVWGASCFEIMGDSKC